MPARRAYTLFSLLVMIASAACITLTRPVQGATTGGDVPLARPGFRAPDVTLPSLVGDPVSLASLRGQPMILTLWACWCPPCRAEMPALDRVPRDYAQDGLVVIGLNLTSQDSVQAASDFAAQNTLHFTILLDENGEAGKIYRTDALPTTFFIARDGTSRDMIVGGPISEALLRAQAERLLAEAP